MAKKDSVAVISTGGKQYRVREGDQISVELLEAVKDGKITFNDILLLKQGDKAKVGNPTVEGASVTGRLLESFKDDKIIVFKKKRRKGYVRTRGHRQQKMNVEIEKISAAPAKAPARKNAVEKKAPAKKATAKKSEKK